MIYNSTAQYIEQTLQNWNNVLTLIIEEWNNPYLDTSQREQNIRVSQANLQNRLNIGRKDELYSAITEICIIMYISLKGQLFRDASFVKKYGFWIRKLNF